MHRDTDSNDPPEFNFINQMSLPEIVIIIHMLKFIKLKIPPGLGYADRCDRPGVDIEECGAPESGIESPENRIRQIRQNNQSSQIFIRWPVEKWTGIQFLSEFKLSELLPVQS